MSVTGTITGIIVTGEFTVRGGSAEERQINLGFKNNTLSTTQDKTLWVIDVDGSNSFRVLTIGSTGSVSTSLWADPSMGLLNVNQMSAHGTFLFNNATSNLLQFRNTPANSPTYITRSLGTEIHLPSGLSSTPSDSHSCAACPFSQPLFSFTSCGTWPTCGRERLDRREDVVNRHLPGHGREIEYAMRSEQSIIVNARYSILNFVH